MRAFLQIVPAGVALALALGGCSGNEFTSGSGGAGNAGGNGGNGGGNSGSGGGGGTGAVPTACPSAKPNDGQPCSDQGLKCSYGTDPRPTCRFRYSCESSGWKTVQSPTACGSQDCPSAKPSGPCGGISSAAVCPYPADGVFCTCSTATTVWQCSQNASGGGCPATLPNEGDTGCTDGTSCCYGLELIGQQVKAECKNNRWEWTGNSC